MNLQKNLLPLIMSSRFFLISLASLILVYLLSAGCSSTSETTTSTLDRNNETPSALKWFEDAQNKRQELKKYLAMSSPRSVQEKTIYLSHPDSLSTDSLKLFIGDVANLAYLIKIGKVYLNGLTKDALSFSAEAQKNSNQSHYHKAFYLNTFVETLNHYENLENFANKIFSEFNSELENAQNKRPSILEEITITGLLEKETSLLNSMHDLLLLKNELITHAVEKVSYDPLLIDIKEQVFVVQGESMKQSQNKIQRIKTKLLRRINRLEQSPDSMISQTMTAQMLTSTKRHLQIIEKIHDSM